MVLSGVSLAWFQEKFTCGSTRVRARFCRSVPVKYCPVNPPDRHMRRSSASTAAPELEGFVARRCSDRDPLHWNINPICISSGTAAAHIAEHLRKEQF